MSRAECGWWFVIEKGQKHAALCLFYGGAEKLPGVYDV
jgi:hypothetical protein